MSILSAQDISKSFKLRKVIKNLSIEIRSGEVVDTVKLVDQCPQTRFILDHCGNMDVTSTDEKAINRFMSVWARQPSAP